MIAVIGCGNPNRTDDGAGLEVIRLLLKDPALQSRTDVKLLDAGTDGMAVMFAARGCETLIVADCCKTGAQPGSVYELPGAEIESRHQPSLNLHDFRWDHAIYAGRQIYRDAFPQDVTAFLIEARSLDLGCGLSADVGNAVLKVAQLIAERIKARPAFITLNGAGP